MENLATIINRGFGRNLSRERRSRGISQAELGKRLVPPLSRATIANLERGTQNVQLHQVFAIATALDTKRDHLIPNIDEQLDDAVREEIKVKFLEPDDANTQRS